MKPEYTEQQRAITAALKVAAVFDVQAEIERRTAFLCDYLLDTQRRSYVLGISGGANPAPHPLHGDAMAQWATDTQFRCGTAQELIWHTRAGNAAYQFEFARAAPGKEAVGAAHGVCLVGSPQMGHNPASLRPALPAGRES